MTQNPLQKDFNDQQPLYSQNVERVKAWFEGAVSQLNDLDVKIIDNTLLRSIGAQTLLYVGESNTAYHTGVPMTHTDFRAQAQKTFGFGNLLAVLDPDVPFDDQWPAERRQDTTVNMAIAPVEPRPVQKFLKPTQEQPGLLTRARKLLQI